MRYVYLGLGVTFLGLGALGALLPILPTTPFLLLAVFFFTRSSPRLKAYVLEHPVFGRYLADYYAGTMPAAQKIRVIALLWLGILISAYLIGSPWAWILLPFIATCVSIHIWLLKPKLH